MATKQGKMLLEAIRDIKNCAKRDGYDYMLYLADDNTYGVTRLFGELTNKILFDMKEIIGFATYDYSTKSARYFSMANRSREAKIFCENLIKKHNIKH